MSVHRLQLEQEIRKAEAEREAEELRLAQRVRAEREQPLAPAAHVVRVLVKRPERAAFETAADIVERWWQRRRRGLLPNDGEVARLVRRVRAAGTSK